MEQMERRMFLRKAGRWTLGLAALGLTGTLASCTNEDGVSTTSSNNTDYGGDTGPGSVPQAPPTSASSTAVVTSSCVGCGKCARGACDRGAISMSGKRAVISDACTGCGDCVRFCPTGAIVLVQSSGGTVTFDPSDTDGPFAAALRASSS